jgi:hypothetical protein
MSPNKWKYFTLNLLFFVFLALLSGCGEDRSTSFEAENFTDIMPQISKLYEKQKESSDGLGNGPCLGVITIENLSEFHIDLVHNPKEAADLLPENQCLKYSSAQKNHKLVEIDFNGLLVSIK